MASSERTEIRGRGARGPWASLTAPVAVLVFLVVLVLQGFRGFDSPHPGVLGMLEAPGTLFGWGGTVLVLSFFVWLVAGWLGLGIPGLLLRFFGAAVLAFAMAGMFGLAGPAAGGRAGAALADLVRGALGTPFAIVLLSLMAIPGALLSFGHLVPTRAKRVVAPPEKAPRLYPQRRFDAEGNELPMEFGDSRDVGPIRFRDAAAAAAAAAARAPAPASAAPAPAAAEAPAPVVVPPPPAPTPPTPTLATSAPPPAPAAPLPPTAPASEAAPRGPRPPRPLSPGVRYADEPAPPPRVIEKISMSESDLAPGVRFVGGAEPAAAPPPATPPLAAPALAAPAPEPAPAPAPSTPVPAVPPEAVSAMGPPPVPAPAFVLTPSEPDHAPPAEPSAADAANPERREAPPKRRRPKPAPETAPTPPAPAATAEAPATPAPAAPDAAPEKKERVAAAEKRGYQEKLEASGLFDDAEDVVPPPPEAPAPSPVPRRGAESAPAAPPEPVRRAKKKPAPAAAPEIPAEEGDEEEAEDPAARADADPLFLLAVEAAIERGAASPVLLTRRLGIGYDRARVLMDRLVEEGIVGDMTASGSRPVKITREDWKKRA